MGMDERGGSALLVLPYGERNGDWLEIIQYSNVLSPCTVDVIMVVPIVLLISTVRRSYSGIYSRSIHSIDQNLGFRLDEHRRFQAKPDSNWWTVQKQDVSSHPWNCLSQCEGSWTVILRLHEGDIYWQ